jgi:hypothetical protein
MAKLQTAMASFRASSSPLTHPSLQVKRIKRRPWEDIREGSTEATEAVTDFDSKHDVADSADFDPSTSWVYLLTK